MSAADEAGPILDMEALQGAAETGSIIFYVAGPREVLRFDPDGKCYVRGKYVADDLELFGAVQRFFKIEAVGATSELGDAAFGGDRAVTP